MHLPFFKRYSGDCCCCESNADDETISDISWTPGESTKNIDINQNLNISDNSVSTIVVTQPSGSGAETTSESTESKQIEDITIDMPKSIGEKDRFTDMSETIFKRIT
ncbi:uncharacterized protein LOC119669720 [Teleopsis dalmanni]|uniref:uncharacterized protein LOC119669720 n=1 Tax=Teleopsis dalmanni TaxID=139649 RepID=UPI0018CE163A|nr:uncharacterized protein LOC119669720 [Teleopsis dalmanni]